MSYPPNNLLPPSQFWAREIERRIAETAEQVAAMRRDIVTLNNTISSQANTIQDLRLRINNLEK